MLFLYHTKHVLKRQGGGDTSDDDSSDGDSSDGDSSDGEDSSGEDMETEDWERLEIKYLSQIVC